MALVNCGECGNDISTLADHCVHCGAPISDELKDKGDYLDNNNEKVIAEYRYSMLDAGPLLMLIFIAILVAGLFIDKSAMGAVIGIICLAGWSMIMYPRPRLTITDRSLIYRDSHSKTHVISFNEIDSITAGGSLCQKLIRAGYLIVRKKGFLKLPLVINGLSDPKEIKKLILKYKN